MRSNYNGEITKELLNQTVTLNGWVNRSRNLGGVIFFDLRDVSGMVQVVVKPESPLYALAETIRAEYVLEVKGKVILRESPNLNIPTGEVEIDPTEIKIINESKPLPIDRKSNDEMRLKYRYLDLRREELQKIFITKSKTVQVIRNYLDSQRFIDCETPILAKSTPEGARDYLVPSRIFKGEFYALPQSPQVMKQLLMVAGFDRYYQVAKCFRDEDLRADRQPEFTQIDIETSFLEQDELLTIMEGMFKKIWKEILNIDLPTPFPRLEWDDAMRDYGSDKPDTRFGLKLMHIEDIFKGIDSPLFLNKKVVGIKVKDENNHFTRKVIDNFGEHVKKHGGENLFFLKKVNGEVSGSIMKLINEDVINALALEDKDVLFMSSSENYLKVCNAMGSLRTELAQMLSLCDDNVYDFKWVINFPLFELAQDGSITSTHHPFTRPLRKHYDYLYTDPLKVYSDSYDCVCHGYEVGGGSMRIYEHDIQQQIFKILNISEEQQKLKFGYLLDAMEYGCPPHGGCAFGLERLLMIIVHSNNIRDVVLFPKTTSAQDLMVDSPNEVDLAQLDELGIQVKKD
ncbi:MAG: aspartate--tRNA ligase [Gammaproteobacteria bacterium]|nr:aspartate--tRNA ligase [Gammaproteobacteria bacterium]